MDRRLVAALTFATVLARLSRSYPLFAVGALLLFCTAAGCGDEQTSRGDFTASVTIVDGHNEETRTFAVGEPVTFVVAVRNTTDQLQTISAEGSPATFQVFRSDTGELLWDSSVGSGLLESATLMSPRSTVRFSDVWSQTDNDRHSVGRGSFTVHALLRVETCINPCGTERHEFAEERSARFVIE